MKLKHLIHFPPGYNSPNGKEFPLILFLHGAGERGSNLNVLKRHGIPRITDESKDFPFIAVSPQCPANTNWNELTGELNELLDEVITHNKVDKNRVYLTGISMGGFGTWNLAVNYPEKFAAIVPICGGGNPVLAYRIKHIPIWVFHGAKDNIVPLFYSEEMVNKLRELNSNVKFTVYPEAEHDSWTQTYNNPLLYQWLLGHHKAKKKD